MADDRLGEGLQGLHGVAIYHLHAKPVQRAKGESAVAGAAYRSSSRLHENSTGLTHDYLRKQGVEHAEILAPDGAPSWVFDRQTLWNTVEAAERRKDAQVAREIEVGLPVELSASEQLALARDFAKREFVARGMIADLAIHRDNPHNPHAHLLLTTRTLTADGFGRKNRTWNETKMLLAWRRGWAEVTNEHLVEAGLGVRIDHRSYKDQKLDLIPGVKIGVSKSRQQSPDLPGFLGERVAEQQRIRGANGAQIIAEPAIALTALSHNQATFTHQDVARFLNTRTEDADQFQAAYLKVTTSPELVRLGLDDHGRERYTTRATLTAERSLWEHAGRLTERGGHGADATRRSTVLTRHTLSAEQRRAVEELTGAGDLKALVGVAGSGKSTALAAMREVWEAEGYAVKGAALAGIAAENLEVAAGIRSRTLASYELAWHGGRDPLTARDVLVIDEAGMIGTRQMARVLEAASAARAKVVLVGDPAQLQAIEAGAPFRALGARHGVSHLTEVRRQRAEWQRTATSELAAGQIPAALGAYERHGGIIPVEERRDARTALLARWAHDAKREPQASQLVLAYTRDEVRALNTAIRTLRQQAGQLGAGQRFETELGARDFAVSERIRFLRNEKTLGVKNGSLGTIEGIEAGVLQVKLDGQSQARIAVDTKFYAHLDHGYAATVHKAQGTTVDRTYVLATPHFDRHSTYVALSRHRDAVTVYYAREDFGGRAAGATEQSVRGRFMEALARDRPQELAHDYLERESADAATLVTSRALEPLEKDRGGDQPNLRIPSVAEDLDARQQQAAERWKARQQRGPTVGEGAEHAPRPTPTNELSRELERSRERTREHRREGPEDDFEL